MAKTIKDTDYLVISARVKAMESGLLTRERMDRMIEARDDAEALKVLSECRYPDAAGLDSTQYSSHKLRHTAATLMLQNGVDVRTLQEVLGHDHLNTTQIYTHVDSEDLRVAAQANPLGKIRQTKKAPSNDSKSEQE